MPRPTHAAPSRTDPSQAAPHRAQPCHAEPCRARPRRCKARPAAPDRAKPDPALARHDLPNHGQLTLRTRDGPDVDHEHLFYGGFMAPPPTDAARLARARYLLRRLADVFPSRDVQQRAEQFVEDTTDRHGN
jgi:hypothetical protein